MQICPRLFFRTINHAADLNMKGSSFLYPPCRLNIGRAKAVIAVILGCLVFKLIRPKRLLVPRKHSAFTTGTMIDYCVYL